MYMNLFFKIYTGFIYFYLLFFKCKYLIVFIHSGPSKSLVHGFYENSMNLQFTIGIELENYLRDNFNFTSIVVENYLTHKHT